MLYEHFLFTRNKRRDFTAFVRPEKMSNRDVSTIASMIGYINHVGALTSDHPALYFFPLNHAAYLLRHYGSHRSHAGRTIGVLEGFVIEYEQVRNLSRLVASVITQQDQYLNIIHTLDDIETQDMVKSEVYQFDSVSTALPQPSKQDRETLNTFVEHEEKARLHLPFTEIGTNLLIQALLDPRLSSPLWFAYGVNSDVVKHMGNMGIDVNMVGYLSAEQPELRQRDNNQLLTTFHGYPAIAFQAAPQSAPSPQPITQLRDHRTSSTEKKQPLVNHDIAQRAKNISQSRPSVSSPEEAKDIEKHLFAEEVLTPRQMRKKYLEEAAKTAKQEQDEPTHHWLQNLIRWLFGSS